MNVAPLTPPDTLLRHRDVIEAALRETLDRHAAAQVTPPRLREAIRYATLDGGKRLRPALVLETFDAISGATPPGHSTRTDAVAAACAVEFVHCFSLVHDDLPAMDDDTLRRGRPTCHVAFGEALAILAGDAMVSMAFQTLADATPARVGSLVRELAAATGPGGMVGGQVLDIATPTGPRNADTSDASGASGASDALRRLHRMKTGALLRAACRLGAMCADADPPTLTAVTRYAEHVGLAFQIVDDVLDVVASADTVGKATKKDADRGKTTYPGLIGLDASRRLADQEAASASRALRGLGTTADGLRELARFVVARSS